jgi:hypothetical protein
MFFGASLPRVSEHHFPPKVASLPDEVGLASCRRQHHFLPKAALRPGMFFAGIASADAFRLLASIN